MPKDSAKLKPYRFEIYKGYEIRDCENILAVPVCKNNTNMTGTQSNDENSDAFVLTSSELIKDAQKIREFRGDGSYALTSFLREVDIVLSFCTQSTNIRKYIFHRIIVNKIQGDALDVIRGLGSDASWDLIKKELINNFSVKETYFQLYHKALSLRNNNNVSEYFSKLKNILAKLNEKHEHDALKPVEFCPRANESLILKTFLDNIDPSLASVVLSRNINTLREAYSLLQTSGLVREKFKNNFCQNNSNNRSSHQTHKNYQSNNHHNNHNNNHAQRNNSGQFRNPFSNRQNSGQFRNSNNSSGQRWPSVPYHLQQRQHDNSNNPAQLGRNRVEPMDVDHIEHETNFQLDPRKQIYR